MSRSYALGVVPDQRPFKLAEYSNGWGWSPSIWDRAVKHVYGYEGYLMHGEGEKYLDRLWAEIEDLPEWVQIPVVLTFDTGVIPGQAYLSAADALDEFERRLPSPENHVNHVPAVATLLRSQPEVPLFGMWGTTVSDNPFDPYNPETDDYDSGIPLSKMYALKQHRAVIEEMFRDST